MIRNGFMRRKKSFEKGIKHLCIAIFMRVLLEQSVLAVYYYVVLADDLNEYIKTNNNRSLIAYRQISVI